LLWQVNGSDGLAFKGSILQVVCMLNVIYKFITGNYINNNSFTESQKLLLKIVLFVLLYLCFTINPVLASNIKSGNTMHSNRLGFEKSPYLLQHADNPVDWYPWGEDAFKKALEEDKPIFLSIGYSTCHWCHVMEHESFENLEVARLLNDTFVCIKVDREERPDVDSVYMSVCQMLTGSGGWPLTIFMTADKKPFYAATYIPKETISGRNGMLDLIPQVKHVWDTDRTSLVGSIDKIMSSVNQQSLFNSSQALESSIFDKAYEIFQTSYDKTNGGFGSSPKFPTPHNLLFLLRYYKRTGNKNALLMVTQTLKKMRNGGIFDQLGYGFHRYSTDAKWLVPHFEKMLYDQALISIAYLEAFQETRDELFSSSAVEIFTYVLNDMTSSEGGFYSAEDADSEGEEGKFYVWNIDEIRSLFSQKGSDLLIDYFNIESSGNFNDEATGAKSGINILNLSISSKKFCEENDLSCEEFKRLLSGFRNKLLSKRSLRPRPFKDDKILTDWNGLMIAAFAIGGRVLNRPEYTAAAEKAAGFINNNLMSKNNGLMHAYREGTSFSSAYLDDYAFFVWGLLELYETTFNVSYLKQAISLNQYLIDNFWDTKNNGFFDTAHTSEKLIMRQKESYDGAVPSGNSVSLLNMIKLARITSDPLLEKKAQQLSGAFADKVEQFPSAHTMFLCAYDFVSGPSYEVVIAGKQGTDDVNKMLSALRGLYLPGKVVILHPDGKQGKMIEQLSEDVKAQKSIDGKATAYVCEGYTCKKPVIDTDQLLKLFIKNSE